MRVLYDVDAAIEGTQGGEQIFFYDAYGNLLTGLFTPWIGTQPLTTYLYSGESFDFRIGQQYLRARWYDPANGRFTGLDPFAGNSSDPQSFHKYAYVHGDPINGVDPTGMFLGAFLTRVRSDATNLAAFLSLKARLLYLTTVTNLRLTYLLGLNALTLYSNTVYTWLPKLEFRLDVLDAFVMFTSGALTKLEEMTADDEERLNRAHPTRAGVIIEELVGANRRGNVSGFDDQQQLADGTSAITQVFAPSAEDEESLKKAIRTKANDFYAKTHRTMYGTDANGNRVLLSPEEVSGRQLQIYIKWTARHHVPALNSYINSLSTSINSVIQVIPIKRWGRR